MTDIGNRRLVMTSEDLSRTIQRMAHQVWERNAGADLALVGIRKRGATIAHRLRPLIQEIAGKKIPTGVLDIGLYRDDIGLTPVAPEVRSTDIPFDVERKTIVLVDDVLFTGRTIRAALNALMDLGRPASVQLLVLIDRGHRELPIQADFTGKEITTYFKENVIVHFQEDDDEEGIYTVVEHE